MTHILIPPTRHNNRHVKTEHKWQWYQIAVRWAVFYNIFKNSIELRFFSRGTIKYALNEIQFEYTQIKGVTLTSFDLHLT